MDYGGALPKFSIAEDHAVFLFDDRHVLSRHRCLFDCGRRSVCLMGHLPAYQLVHFDLCRSNTEIDLALRRPFPVLKGLEQYRMRVSKDHRIPFHFMSMKSLTRGFFS
jgi:hypothetical protein